MDNQYNKITITICAITLLFAVFGIIAFSLFITKESSAQLRPSTPIPPEYASALKLSTAELWMILKVKAKTELWDASIIADDDKNTFLGKISAKFDTDSIFYNYGDYGSKFGTHSIWNNFSDYGGKFSEHSAFNKLASSPPLIVKNRKIIGRLTISNIFPDAIPPHLLRAIFIDEQ